jgi:hypothetical protein
MIILIALYYISTCGRWVGKIDDRLNNIEISQGRLEENFEAQEKIVTELKGSQNKEIWALIVLAFTAVVSLVIGLGKFIFYPNPTA